MSMSETISYHGYSVRNQ